MKNQLFSHGRIRTIFPLLLLFLFGLFASNANGQCEGQADCYRAASVAARDAAAKCPARRACYLTYAAYTDCLANNLNSRTPSTTCTAPTCSIETPPCEGSPGSSPSGNSTPTTGSPPAPTAQEINRTGEQLGNAIADALQASAEAKLRRALANGTEIVKQRKARENSILVDEIEEELKKIESSAKKSDRIERELSGGEQSAPVVVASSRGWTLANGNVPALPGNYGGQDFWSPWYVMKTINGGDYPDLNIAFWYGGTNLPSSTPRDLSTSWVLRNRSQNKLTVKFELLIRCVEVCVSGWYTFEETIPTNGNSKVFPTRQLFQIEQFRVLNVGFSTAP